MKRENYRILLIAATILIAAFYLYPTYQFYFNPPENPDELERVKRGSINLGLDLQGGIHLVLEVDPSKLSEDERRDVVERVQAIITNRVDQFGVAEPIIQREGEWRIVVELPGIQEVERAQALIGRTARLEFKILEPPQERAKVLDRIEDLLQARAVDDTTRADDAGLFEARDEEKPSIKRYMTSLPFGEDEYDWLVPTDKLLTVKAILEKDPEVQAVIPKDGQFLWASTSDMLGDNQEYRRLYYVKSRVEMTGDVVKDAKVTTGQSFENAGQAIINFSTTNDGVKLFSRVTGAHVNERMAIILDDQIYSAPTIQVKIRDGRGIITGSGSVEEAKDLAIVLRAGALPADVNIVEDRTVGPSLGRDSIAQGKKAAAIGLVIVMIFMVLYYGLSGLVADIALALNLLFVLAILSGFHGTLTLPGIAGIILTIGMAVDANVLIFERVREELKTGKTVRSAIDTGYGRAFLTIVDANLTTIITAIVLYQFGTGPIKGFALTLMIGILSSMFTALFVTRTILNFFTSRQETPSLSIGRLNIFGETHIDFMGLRRIAFVVSAVLILIGLGSVITKGGYNLGIDFAGGTVLELHFDPAVSVGDIRNTLDEVEVEGVVYDLRRSEIKQFGPPTDILIRVEEGAEGNKMADAIKTRLRSAFGDNIPGDKEWLRRQEAVGPKIGSELKRDAVSAIFVSLLLIILYIWWRFKQIQYGVAAVVALFHDVLITLGVFSLLDMEISLAIVAALLTIVGYSLNDTIVVFDRIREDLRLYRRESFMDILNRSINEVLNRTVLTSGTTMLVVIALLVLGGEVIYSFAFALLIGVIVGTYSSSFVASPVVLIWQAANERKKIVASGSSRRT
jgi:SecD/SecF fusion protein